MSNGAWSAYLAELRQLHAIRAAETDRGESTEETVRARAEQLDALAARVRQQEKTVVALAFDLRKPVRFVPTDVTDPASPLPWDEAVEDMEDRLHVADRAIEDVRHFGNRPQLLPDWQSWARNGAVYFALSLPNVFINWALWLFYATGESVSEQFTVAAWGCCFWPIATVALGIVVIRTLGAPRIKPRQKSEFDQPKDTEIPLNIHLGFAISAAVSALSIGVIWLLGAALGK